MITHAPTDLTAACTQLRSLTEVMCDIAGVDEDVFDPEAIADFVTDDVVAALDTFLGHSQGSRDALMMILSFDHPYLGARVISSMSPEAISAQVAGASEDVAASEHIVGLSPREPDPQDLGVVQVMLRAYAERSSDPCRAVTTLAWFVWAAGHVHDAGELAAAALVDARSEQDAAMARMLITAANDGLTPAWMVLGG